MINEKNMTHEYWLSYPIAGRNENSLSGCDKKKTTNTHTKTTYQLTLWHWITFEKEKKWKSSPSFETTSNFHFAADSKS